MGERIAYLGVDKRVSTEVILRAAAAAREALGEETPSDFFVWIQRAESAKRVRWFGLHAHLRSSLFAPSDNVVDCMAEHLDHVLIIRRYGVTGTTQLESFVRPPGKRHLACALSILGQEGELRVVRGALAQPVEEGDAVDVGLAALFPGEEKGYWDAWDDVEFYAVARDGSACAPTKVDEDALDGARNFLAHFVDDDDLERAFPDPDDAPPPESGEGARGAAPAIPTTWPELLARLAARVPKMDASFAELGAPNGSSAVLDEPTRFLAARALAERPEATAAWVARSFPHADAAMRRTSAGFGAADTLAIARFVAVATACGAPLGADVEGCARRLIEMTAPHAAAIAERGRRSLLVAALGLGMFREVAAISGGPLPLRVPPGKKHSFGIDLALVYLAAGLAAKQQADDLASAFHEIVAGFPYLLLMKKLDEADLLVIARAWYVHALGRPAGETARLLAIAVRGDGPAAAPIPKYPIIDGRARDPLAHWGALGPKLRDDAAITMGELRALTAQGKALPPERLAGELLAEVAEKLARHAVVDPQMGVFWSADFAGLMARAIGEVPAQPSFERAAALLGTLAYVVVSSAGGAATPPFETIERGWLGLLAKTHVARALPDALHRALLFASLGAGVHGLLPILTGKSGFVAKRGEAPRADVEDIALHLGVALAEGWTMAEALPAFRAYYERFPAFLVDGEATFFELLCVLRAQHVQIGKQPTRGLARHLCSLVQQLAPPPAKPPPPPLQLVPAIVTPRPTRTAPLPTALGWSRLELRDVEGLHGGVVIVVFSDGDYWFEDVERGAKSSRIFRSTMPPEGVAALSALLVRHDPRRIQIVDRPGIPGESRPTLTLAGPGLACTVSKWSNVRHPDFDALVGFLRAGAEHVAKTSAPLWTGPHDWDWRPG